MRPYPRGVFSLRTRLSIYFVDMTKVIAGVDPGVSPAVAVVSGNRVIRLVRIPDETAFHSFDETEFARILSMDCVEFVVLERVGVMAKQGISSAGRLMLSLGLLRGVCGGLHIPYLHPTPQTWKKAVLEVNGYDMGRETDDAKKVQKASAVACAGKLFPKAQLVKKGCRTPDHNLAEALLMARYGQIVSE